VHIEVNNKMKPILNLALLTVGMISTCSVLTVRAKTIDITFTQTGQIVGADGYGNNIAASTTDAYARLDVSGNNVLSGNLVVTTGPDAGSYQLIEGSGSDGAFEYDTTWPADSTAGLAWSLSGSAGNSTEMNLWFNLTSQYGQPAGTFSLWGSPNAGYCNWYNVESYGTVFTPPPLTIVKSLNLPSVPDGGMTAGLLGSALLGLQAVRRKLFC
jgi:hypothetical protein